MSALRLYIADDQRHWDICKATLTYNYECSVHRAIDMKPLDLLLTKMLDTIALKQRLGLSPTPRSTGFKMQYLNCIIMAFSAFTRGIDLFSPRLQAWPCQAYTGQAPCPTLQYRTVHACTENTPVQLCCTTV